jgi:hypothetical protein
VKLILLISIPILILVALALWGNRIAGQALDALLAPLLTRELGLPVKLAPIQARLLRLQARCPKLVIGDPNDPVMVAHDVEVKVALSDLLKGEVRLVNASGSHLMVRPSRWPGRGDTWPDNYQFLDPWLPKTLQLEQGGYVTGSGDYYPVRQLRWRRMMGGGASLDWLEDRDAGALAIKTTLVSLQDLLTLSPVSLEATVEAQGKSD